MALIGDSVASVSEFDAFASPAPRYVIDRSLEANWLTKIFNTDTTIGELKGESPVLFAKLKKLRLQREKSKEGILSVSEVQER